MASIKDRATGAVDDVRERRPFVDHMIRMVQHYGTVNGNRQAGAVTYFGFLSFFPILALAFFAVGIVSRVYSGAEQDLINGLNSVFPDTFGDESGEISVDQLQTFSGLAGIIGLVGVIYTGSNWLAAMRDSLEVMFELPKFEQPNFVMGKLRDVVSLATIGTVLIVALAATAVLGGLSDVILDLLGLGEELSWALGLISVAVGFIANVVLFTAMFRILANPPTPRRALIKGAILAAVLFELLKRAATFLVSLTEGKPSAQAFGIALIVLVLIYYFHRVVMYAAAFAHTSPSARAAREQEPSAMQGPMMPSMAQLAEIARADERPPRSSWVAPFAGGAAAMLGLVAVLRKRGNT